MGPTIQIGIACMAVLPILALGQTKSDQPIQTTVCEVVKSPALFNGKIITLRSPIQIAFEEFGLSASDCTEKKIDYLWLEYGRGPKRQPTTWCCGDMVSGVNYFSRSATIILPYDDNYELGLTALAAYTGADRSRG